MNADRSGLRNLTRDVPQQAFALAGRPRRNRARLDRRDCPSGIALAQMANANLNPRTESKVDTKNPDRGPLLILDGEKDHTVPWAIANAAYKRQKRNPSVTEIQKMPNRGHSLTIDHGWQEVAQTALDFVKRFVPAKPS
jgi:pimeloyl-ACP methyl ester carboxylesterase